MDYITAKWLHVLSSTLLFGTGIGSAYYMLMASLTRDPRVVARVVRLVVIADWIFTSTTVILQPATGFWMTHVAGIPLATRWVSWSIVLYIVAIACWLPVVWIQIRMQRIAQEAVRKATPLPKRYFDFLKIWTALGTVAFFAFIAIFWLMVAKPS